MARSRRGDLMLVAVVYVVVAGVSVAAFGAVDHLHPLVAVLLVDLAATLVVFVASTAVRNNSMYDRTGRSPRRSSPGRTRPRATACPTPGSRS